jgi:sulfoxide reductase heme-binding subunit YedZ
VSALWYLTRGTGAVSLLLLTASVVLGILGPLRVSSGRWPRFALETVHRDVSLLVMVILVIHIATSVLDSFAPISLTAAVIPFISSYRPLWLGLGGLAFDLLLALVVTSLIRRRLGYARWRLVHWLAYASWPVAVLHGLGTGSDAKLWWMLLLTIVCGAAVVVAVLVRVGASSTVTPSTRSAAVLLSLATPLAIAVFAVAGPLRKGWARRAGTPASLLGHSAARTRPAVSGVSTSSGNSIPASFSARLAGTIHKSRAPGGEIVNIDLRLQGGPGGRLRVRLGGAPDAGGGLSMTGSQVDLLTGGTPTVMAGQVDSLNGDSFVARVLSSAGTLTLHTRLAIDTSSDSVTGVLRAVR